MAKKPKGVGRALWITRDAHSPGSIVEFWRIRPQRRQWGKHILFESKQIAMEELCYEDFFRWTGYPLKPGTCERVRINVEEVTK